MITKIHLHEYLTLSYAPTILKDEYVLLFETIKNPWKMFSFMQTKELGFATQKQLEQLLNASNAEIVEKLILHIGTGLKTNEDGLSLIIGGDFYPQESLNQLINKEISLIDFYDHMVAPAKKGLNKTMIFQQIADHTLACCYIFDDGVSIFSPTLKPLYSLPFVKLEPYVFEDYPIGQHLSSIPSSSTLYLNSQYYSLKKPSVEFLYDEKNHNFAFYLNNILDSSALDNSFRLASEYLLSYNTNDGCDYSLLSYFQFFLLHEYYEQGHIPFVMIQAYTKSQERDLSNDFNDTIFNNLLDYYSKDKLRNNLEQKLTNQNSQTNNKSKI